MITHTKMWALVGELAQAKSKQDINAAMDIYHPQVELFTPSLNARGMGTQEARQQLEVFFHTFPDYAVSIEQHAFNQNLVLATALVTVTPTLTPELSPAPSSTVSKKVFPTVTVPAFMEFHFKDDKIVKEVFHLDFEHIYKKSGLTAEELYSNNQNFKKLA